MAYQLTKPDFFVLDGGLATQLEAHGHDLLTDLWSARLLLEQPEAIAKVHREYLTAGADCITSASYQATLPGFLAMGLSEQDAASTIGQAVRLAQATRDEFWNSNAATSRQRCPLVAASVGPYGAYLANGAEFTGDYDKTQEQLRSFHEQRWHLLAAESPDLMLCETIPSISEAKAIGDLANQSLEIDVWISFSCRDGKHISDGTPMVECARTIDRLDNVTAIGVNCTAPEFIADLIEEIRKGTEKPIVVYPNSGETFNPTSRAWEGVAEVNSFTDLAKSWRDLGVHAVGGCCRTTPDHIRALRTLFEA
jgi:homocysteine S-methyltransferase